MARFKCLHISSSAVFLVMAAGILLFWPTSRAGAESTASFAGEETRLRFVGEDIDVQSIASRREESAWQAPAVARVITREELFEHGHATLSEALSRTAGFYMAEKPWGTSPYLRGIANSTLFLYDTVPLIADSDKSLHQLDYNLSLAPVEQVEIVRGPGSVLWGPDAFAGIVNVVPRRGRDIQGVETGVSIDFEEESESVFLNMGGSASRLDGFLSLSARRAEEEGKAEVIRFWRDRDQAVPPAERYGQKEPGRSRYFEVSGRFSIQDLFEVSGRLTENHHPYLVSDQDLSWLESRSTSSGFLKLEAVRDIDLDSSLRFTGFYNELRPEYEFVDKDLKVNEKTWYGELIYDHTFFTARGLFTGGISFRKKDISNAPVWESYFPDFFRPENDNFLPFLVSGDYQDILWSLFSQYSHQFNNLKIWSGLRFDDHDNYQDKLSFSSGLSYSPSRRWVTKLLYGTAYRTPFSRQFLAGDKPEQEKIESLGLQLSLKPRSGISFSLAAFANSIEHHIDEDTYAGLSLPNSQDLYGMELEGEVSVTDNLELQANLTLLDSEGPDETYHLLSAVFVRPDGTVENIFEDISSPYDIGPETMFNLSARWRPRENLKLVADLRYTGERDLINLRTGETLTADSVTVIDLTATVRDLFSSGLDLQASAENLLDTDYEVPGAYVMREGEPFSLRLMLRKKF